MRLPIIRDVLKINRTRTFVRSLRTQNRHLSEVSIGKRSGVCYRRRARNDLECHPVLEVSPELYHRLIKAGFVYVGLQRRPVWDQSPLVQCSRCLGYGHGKRFAKKCPRGRLRGHHMGRSAQSAGSEQNGMIWLGRRWRTAAAGALAADHAFGRGSSTEGCTDRVSLRFMQSNLQRKSSKDGSAEGPVKAAIMVSSDVDVEEDQTLNGENVAAAVIKAGNRIGVVSVYFEETCPSARTSIACDTSAQNSGPTKSSWGDVSAWSVWWGSERNDARGVDLCDFLDSEGLHERGQYAHGVYRGSSPQSVVDVTACSSRSTG
ncbi:hypothetical protein EVAR_91924_1 [Eumeta japonica]|uniref:Uncharacterized protein n=1 Tax=Eumeta variegata TaxID=151549 RepID=A0A4C1SU82_EUMVA|nr:hypothetical protein EVAR_91924_1 [Eumeta japonica]